MSQVRWKGVCVKVLRFLALLATVLAVYVAQYLVEPINPVERLPLWLLDLLPSLRPLLGWSPGNLQILAFALAITGGVLFGLIAQPWQVLQPAQQIPPRVRTVWAVIGWVLLLLAVSMGTLLLFNFFVNGAETVDPQVLWAISIVSFSLGAWLLTSEREEIPADPALIPARPEAGWPTFLIIFALAAFLYTWQLDLVPNRVDGDVASHGLQALSIVHGDEERLFAPGWANIPLLAYYPAAMAILFSGDWIIGNRLAGTYAGLLTLLGVWLLGCELFRRPVYVVGTGDKVADRDHIDGRPTDDGRHSALLATAFTAIGYTFLHFSRLPQYLEPVAWGTLALWALHRGVRTNNRLFLGAAGLLLGMSASLYYSGRVFLVVALLWWLWFLFSRRDWLRSRLGGVGLRGFAIWLAGIFVFLAPLLGYWLRSPFTFLQRIQEVSIFGSAAQIHMEGVYRVQGTNALLWESFKRALLTFNFYGDSSTHFGYGGSMLDPLVAPLLVLGFGVILLNLDRLLSWLLLLWFASVVIMGGMLTVNTPFWPRLLPALPVVGLIIALATDRWAATLYATGGQWLRHLGSVAVLGVLLIAGVLNWVNYYDIYSVHNSRETVIGRTLRRLPADQTPFLIVGEGRIGWDERTVQYLAALPYRDLPQGEIHIDDWPQSLPPRSAVFLFPDDVTLAAELEERYPGGIYRIFRNRLANPILVLYELP
jgi:hypothetical protein